MSWGRPLQLQSYIIRPEGPENRSSCRGAIVWRMLSSMPVLRASILLSLAALFSCDGSGRSAPTAATSDSLVPTAGGERVFKVYCEACHQADGQGIDNGPPPLLGSSWVAGPPERIVRVVLHGLRGKVEVGGRTYNLEMPGFAMVLDNAEIADVLTLVRARFGKIAAPITADTVARIRAAHADRSDYWTAEELRRFE